MQVCAGLEAKCETVVHVMDSILNDGNRDAVLLIDAKNAFLLVKREPFIQRVKILYPAFATFLSNCYSSSCRLFIIGGGELQFTGETRQGDPIAMTI